MKLLERRAHAPTMSQQEATFTRRALVVGGLQGGIAAVIVGRLAWLTTAEHQRFSELAEANRARATLIPPRRGDILDRFGKPIAINQSDFRVDLIPDLMENRDAALSLLTAILNLTSDDTNRIQYALSKAAGFQPVQVAEKITYEQFASVNLRLNELPGVIPSQGFSRLYPSGSAVAHLVGYIGAPTAEDYKKERNPLFLTPGFKIGKQGIEKTFDALMRGEPGAKRSEVTAKGRFVQSLPEKQEIPGRSLPLTIDAGLQNYMAERVGTESISGVLIDCQSGDILSMISMPAFDPNSFSRGISHSEWNMLSADDHLPLVNKVLQGLYPAGSTVKPMNALAFLEAGVSPDETVLCTGVYKVGNSAFHCYKHGGHGSINMHRAVQQSCDIYFYTMARRVGTQKIADMARRLGLGEKFALPVPYQRFGTVPSPEWKEKKYRKAWTVSDTLNSAIGQGYTLVNSLQLAVMAARIGGGLSITPRLVHRRDDPTPSRLPVNPAHLKFVCDAMGAVVGPGGTAARATMHVAGIAMGGKTGSAQVRRISAADRAAGRAVALGTRGEWRLRDHGLFIAITPFDNPRYAAAFIHEHAGHGTFAAEVARDSFTYLYDRDQALRSLAQLQPTWGGDIATRIEAQRSAWNIKNAPQSGESTPEDGSAIENADVPTTPSVANAEIPPE